jgi:hypothetical protein
MMMANVLEPSMTGTKPDLPWRNVPRMQSILPFDAARSLEYATCNLLSRAVPIPGNPKATRVARKKEERVPWPKRGSSCELPHLPPPPQTLSITSHHACQSSSLPHPLDQAQGVLTLIARLLFAPPPHRHRFPPRLLRLDFASALATPSLPHQQ